MCTWLMFNLQNANSPTMENLIFFHDHAMMIIIMITVMILYIMLTLIFNNLNNKFILHNQFIEIIWTIMPMITLMFLAIPSLKILYFMDEIFTPSFTIKCIGNQWYWKFEYSDFKNMEFTSFMLKLDNSSSLSLFRLLDVDNRMIIPANIHIRLMISSVDVIHSWTIPSMGLKIDAIPGRINQIYMMSDRPGIYFGQCSEICGMNHSFMPIVIESTSSEDFMNWLKMMY